MFNKPRGTNDIFGQKIQIYQYINQTFSQLLLTYNYQEIVTPIFEQKEVFVRGVGTSSDIVSKEMYEFNDRKGRNFVLRPEGTSGVVRAVIENKMYVQNNLPIKVYYSGPMFRYERPQAGRNREFLQLGIESFGINSVGQDLEVIVIAMEFLAALQLSQQSKLYVNYLISGTNREKYIVDLKTYLKTFNDLCDDCKNRMETNPLRSLDCKIDGSRFVDAPNMQTYLSVEEQKTFNDLINLLNELDYEVIIDNKLVRGLDYYTGFVFEIKYTADNEFKDLTLIAGGRYNNLVQELDGPSLPAAGFGAGFDRIASLLLNDPNLVNLNEQVQVYVGILGNFSSEKWKLVTNLRLLGLNVETNLETFNLKQIFKAAQKYQVKKLIILGDEEIKNQTIKIKDQTTGVEVERKVNELNLDDLI